MRAIVEPVERLDRERRAWTPLVGTGLAAALVGVGGIWVALHVEPVARLRMPAPGNEATWVHAGVTPWVWMVGGATVPLWAWLARRPPSGGRLGFGNVALHAALVIALVIAASRVFQFAAMGRWDGPLVGIPTLLAWSLPLWIVISVVQTTEASATNRERELEAARLRAQLAEAQSQVLASKLRPHFLFNTLQGISTQIHARPDAADRMLGHLSRLLRDSLERGDASSHPLREELATLEPFIAIARQRFGDRFRYEEDVDEAMLAAAVPVYLLQPLVENAIEHGIARKPGPGSVRITARCDARTLRIDVEDDGPGLGATEPRYGFGLRSVEERLRDLPGGSGGLQLRECDGGGLRAEVRLPIDAEER